MPFIYQSSDMIFLLTFLACGLFIIYGALIVTYQRAWKAIPVFVPGAAVTTRISVLIPARNEEKNIVDCLRSLAQQNYPKDRFEVIVLDDHSTDDTAAAVNAFVGGGLRVYCVRMAEVPQSETVQAFKKFAIETGV